MHSHSHPRLHMIHRWASIRLTFNKKFTRTHTHVLKMCRLYFVYFILWTCKKNLQNFRHFMPALVFVRWLIFLLFISFQVCFFLSPSSSSLNNQCHHKSLICIKFLIFHDMILFFVTALYHSKNSSCLVNRHRQSLFPFNFTQFTGSLATIEIPHS